MTPQQKAYERALIAFASCVLDIMHHAGDWGPDQMGEIADASHNLGLAYAKPNDLAGNFMLTKREEFANPLNL